MLSSILDLILIVEKRRYYISEENKQKYSLIEILIFINIYSVFYRTFIYLF